ncbi:MAG TPA: hypothetical protein VJ697_02735 [Nitrososphaeraceae archaeon]|nr:hypothetical protein [Nitrososphaeraceae archaeon]
MVGGIGNDHLIGELDADTFVCGLGYDIIIGLDIFESDIKTSD